MKSTFANARENLSDAQLKHVTGGARVNSRPEAPDAHLIDHGNRDLHAAAAADGHWRPTHPGPAALIGEATAQGDPVTITNFPDRHHAVVVAAPPGLPDNDGRDDAGERENTTWPLPSAPYGGH